MMVEDSQRTPILWVKKQTFNSKFNSLGVVWSHGFIFILAESSLNILCTSWFTSLGLKNKKGYRVSSNSVQQSLEEIKDHCLSSTQRKF